MDSRILARESAAVARRAAEDGVAQRRLEPDSYQETLAARLGTGRETLRGLILRARRESFRVVFAEGTNDTVLRACSVLRDEEIARPILLGREEDVHGAAERLRLDLGGMTIVDPARSPRLDSYVEEYYRMRRRRGIMRATAAGRLRQEEYFGAMMVHLTDADMMIAGVTTHYGDSLRTILEVIGPAPGLSRVSSLFLFLLPKKVLFLADCAVNVDPTAEELAEIALLASRTARDLGVEPRTAVLSFSNFGSVDHPVARKARRAVEIARQRAPGLVIDGEMHLMTALDGRLRREQFPFSDLTEDANVLVFPELQSGNLALHLLESLGAGVPVGPLLLGTRLPVHLVQYGMTSQDIVNLTTMGIVHAAARRAGESSVGTPEPWARAAEPARPVGASREGWRG